MNRDELKGSKYTTDLLFHPYYNGKNPNPKHREQLSHIRYRCLFGTNCIAFRQPRRHFTYSQNYVIRHPDFNEDMECLS